MARLSLGIVGGGIAGLTAALALARRGHAITLIERRPEFTELGAGLQISPNSSRILVDLGLDVPLRQAAAEPDRVVIRAIGTGQEIGQVALGPFMQARFGAPYWVIHRPDLQRILLEAVHAEPAIRLLMGRTVAAVSQSSRAVTLTLATEKGETEPAFDAVLGADGIGSSLRRALGDERTPRYRGAVAWRSTIPVAKAPPALAGNETGLWLGRRGHVVHYPIAGGRLLNVVAIERGVAAVEGWSAPGDASALLAGYADAAPLLRDLLARAEAWQRWSLSDLPARRLAKGRIGLLGDAGHPVLPYLAQGAALGIEDAAALAALLGKDPVEDLKAYERERLRRVRRVQREARRNGRIYHAGPLVSLGRDLVLRGLGPERMAERYAWLYGYGAK